MTAFILQDQKLLVIETNNLQFGGSTPSQISCTLDLDESVVTSSPTVTASIENTVPFTIALIENTVLSKPTINFTLSQVLDSIVLGQKYTVTLTVGGNTDTFSVQFLFSQFYDPAAWTNTTKEDSLSGFVTLTEIPSGANLLSTIVNSKLRSLIEFLGLMNFRILDILSRYRLKRNLPDIINAAIYSGTIPAGYTGVVNYANGTTQISSIVLQDTNNDSNSFTKISFTYADQTSTVTKTDSSTNPPTTITTTKTYSALSSIEVSRVTALDGTTKQYRISNIAVTRTNVTFTSVVDNTYSITMPLVSGWTVTE